MFSANTSNQEEGPFLIIEVSLLLGDDWRRECSDKGL